MTCVNETLRLFNAVQSGPTHSTVNLVLENKGLVIAPEAEYCVDQIASYYEENRLNGNDLNKTFHKSWQKIKDSDRFELYLHQIVHYLSTYGTNFEGEIYIPHEELDIPEDLRFIAVNALTIEELIAKCMKILKSGIALTEETINDILYIFDDLGFKPTTSDGIRNKEAVIKIADKLGVYPSSPEELLRYVVFKSIESTLLIKDKKTIDGLTNSKFNPNEIFKQFGLKRLATIFNRFKPLFLAFKNKCPSTINKISKLSKKYHKPMKVNPLNTVTKNRLSNFDINYLDNATTYALFKAIIACHSRLNIRSAYMYRIRNGKSFVKAEAKRDVDVCSYNLDFILKYLKDRINIGSVHIPDHIEYALPTSEKQYIGNIPSGTKIKGKNLVVGVYWQNDWSARDIDLSAVNMAGKVGWNASYDQFGGRLMYSGDITNAPNGAVEYLYRSNGAVFPSLVQANIYSGNTNCHYKIIAALGDGISRDYMMDPNNLVFEAKCQSIQKQNILGLYYTNEDSNSVFVVTNVGAGSLRISRNSDVSALSTQALIEQWSNQISLNRLFELLDVEILPKDEAEINLCADNLTKSTFIDLFESNTDIVLESKSSS